MAGGLLAQNCPDRALGTVVGNGDDVMLSIRPIGFAFPFAGATYTDVHICTNGYFHLSNAGVPAPGVGDGSSTAAELASGSPRICALWSDHNLTTANGANVYINSTPTKCTITWDRAITFGSTSGTLFSFQAQLLPTGEVKFYYDANTTNNSTFSAAFAAGLVGASPGVGAVLPAASDISVGGATTDNTLFETYAALGFDMPLQSLQLIPTNPGWAYVATPWSGCAATSQYGTGCYKAADSIYEFFATAASNDLNGRTITMLRQPNGYLVLDSIPGTFVTPSGTAQVIAVGDDVVSPALPLSASMPVAGGSTSSIVVNSNGVVNLSGTGNGAGFDPVTATFLGWAQTAVCCWHDYNNTIAGSGSVKFEEVGGIAYVTWDGVYSFLTTTPDTVQFQLNVATGDITIVFSAIGAAGDPYLVGYSVGGPSVNPGATDLSTALATPVTVNDAALAELKLAPAGLPFLGNASFGLTISDVPALVPLAFAFFGSGALPGIDLGFAGAGGCSAYTTADFGALTVPIVGTSGTQPFAIPNNPAFIGVSLTAQGAAFTLLNSLGLVTSNGVQFTVGG
ncbi:MAG: hypothetical protein MUC36_21375 [Planctomycetes bacterium]|nr:hypothetical protein [Planctomycetota bacterium]